MELNDNKRLWVVGGLLFVLGFVVRAGLAYFAPNIYWPDEIYQTLEPAHRLIFGYGRVKWEYHEGLRSWVFPGILGAVMWLGQFFGEGSKGYIGATTVFLTLVSLIPAGVTYLWARREWDDGWWAVLAMVFPLVWFEAVYFGPKSLYEVFTIHLVVAGIFLIRFSDDRWVRPFVGGMLIGVCIIARPHLAPVPVVLGFIIPLYARRPHAIFSALVCGVTAGATLAGLVDVVAYGVPFHSLIVNLHTNVIEGKASDWGTFPWWQYFAWAWEVSRLGAVAMGTALIVGAIRHPMLAWPALILLGAHCVIPHKEYRFLYPVVVVATMLLGLDAVELGRWLARRFRVRRAKVVFVSVFLLLWTYASISAALEFNLRSTGERQDHLNWTESQGVLRAYRYLSTQDICGLGRVGFWEICTGGYAYLHHNVEIPPLGGPDAIRKESAKFDAFLVRGWERQTFGEYTRSRCFGDYCIYRRDGPCD